MRKKNKGPFYGATIKCLNCGTTIQSSHVHDYVSCKCKVPKNPEKYCGVSIDGGSEYCRMAGSANAKYEILDGGNYSNNE
jgi:hypothetical protein